MAADLKVAMLLDMFPAATIEAVQTALRLNGNDVQRAASCLVEQPTTPTPPSPWCGAPTLPNEPVAHFRPGKQKAYSRLQSGSTLPSSRAGRGRSPAAPAAPAPGSFADVLLQRRGDADNGAVGATATPRGAVPTAAAASLAASPGGVARGATPPPLHRLQTEHAWASTQVLQLVLDVCSGDERAARQLLADMAPTEGGSASGHGAPGGASGRRALSGGRAGPAGYADERDIEVIRAVATRPGERPTRDDIARAEALISEPASAAGQQDIYWLHRREAVRLTHAWQRLFRRAMTALAQGDDSMSRQLMSQAQALRTEAVEAHSQAAHRIEIDVNRHRSAGPWEIDLHGLHAGEAVDALHRRLVTLHSLPLDQRRGRMLRVVTGRGLHSGGGEAVVPRAVENYLLNEGWSFSKRMGALDVALRWGGGRGLASHERPDACHINSGGDDGFA